MYCTTVLHCTTFTRGSGGRTGITSSVHLYVLYSTVQHLRGGVVGGQYNLFCTLALSYTVHMYTCIVMYCKTVTLVLYCTTFMYCTTLLYSTVKLHSTTVLFNFHALYCTVQYCTPVMYTCTVLYIYAGGMAGAGTPTHTRDSSRRDGGTQIISSVHSVQR